MKPSEFTTLFEKCAVDPVYFCKHVLGVNLWEKQERIIESVRDNPNTAVASAHGVGKTFISACTTLWFLFTHPDSRIITTAPTARQVESILWAEIANLYNNAKVPLGGRLLKTSIGVDDKWFAMGLSTDDPTRFQGHHAKDILLIMDEAPGVDPSIYEASQGILTSSGAKCLLIGNPTSPSGPFFDKFKSPLWKCFFISAYDSPAIKNAELYPNLTTMKWIDERRDEWGEASPMFISRVLGRFPEEGEDTLIPLSWAEAAVKRYEDAKKCVVTDKVYLGLDVARYGVDKTVLCTYMPNRLIHIKSIQKKSLMDAVSLVTLEASTYGTRFVQVAVDDTGMGGGVVDRLREISYPTIAINFAQKAQDQRHFLNVRDEMYWIVRELFRSNEIAIPNNEALINQLCAIRYKINSKANRIEIESKDDMKKRGMRSPDEADSFCLAVYAARRFNASSVSRRVNGTRTSAPIDRAYY